MQLPALTCEVNKIILIKIHPFLAIFFSAVPKKKARYATAQG